MTIPKRMGRDCELSTTGLTADGRTVRPWRVTRHVLTNIGAAFEPTGGRVWSRPLRWPTAGDAGADGRPLAASPQSGSDSHGGYERTHAPATRPAWVYGEHSSDALRHWTSSGQCFYSDMAHVEVAGAETADPRRLAAQGLSALRVAEAARQRAEADAPPGTTYALTTANVDIVDAGISWGTHFNVSVEPELWEDLCLEVRHPTRLGSVSSAIAALIPFFGAGYVLPLRSGARFSLSGRAHHLTRLSTLATTDAYRRGLLNQRREAHSDTEDRLHLIGFDFALASGALLASTLQCVLAAAELGLGVEGLYDPVRATRAWSFGLDGRTGHLTGVARTARGGGATLPTFMRELVTLLLHLVDDGSISDEVAPCAGELLPKVLELTHYLEEGSLTRSAPHLDWAAKLLVLTDLCRGEGVSLDDMRVRVADHDYASSDPGRGHFWRLWEEGRVDPLVSLEDVEASLVDGPEDGRGWARGRLIREFGDRVTDVDWSYVELRDDERRWRSRVRVEMPQTGSLSRDFFEPVLADALETGDLRLLESGAAPSRGRFASPTKHRLTTDNLLGEE